MGHGSGADAVLRLAEGTQLWGMAVIGPCDEYPAAERHGRPLHWVDIRRNCPHFREHFYSTDDAFVTESESEDVGSNHGTESRRYSGRGRFRKQVRPPLSSSSISSLPSSSNSSLPTSSNSYLNKKTNN